MTFSLPPSAAASSRVRPRQPLKPGVAVPPDFRRAVTRSRLPWAAACSTWGVALVVHGAQIFQLDFFVIQHDKLHLCYIASSTGALSRGVKEALFLTAGRIRCVPGVPHTYVILSDVIIT